MSSPTVMAVHKSTGHSFSKAVSGGIELVAGLGVAGDAHCGARVQHQSRVSVDPSQPNLRQVHLMHAELHSELGLQGHVVKPGDLGENITTRGVDLLNLPTGAVLKLGSDALVAVTGLRNPCLQIERYQVGLLKHVLSKDATGIVVRKAGVMGVVLIGGVVHAGDAIAIGVPPGPPHPLGPV
ncbi:MAG: MOSC domain-containing protein [bacterium]|nr:MOSC domain-containing protein [bacterium]